jgi:hypothetical protein
MTPTFTVIGLSPCLFPRAILFVESDEASFVAGHTVAVDGVKSAGRTTRPGESPIPRLYHDALSQGNPLGIRSTEALRGE